MCTDKIFPVYPGHLCWIRQSLKFSLEAFWIVIRHYNLSRFKLHSMKSWRKLDQRQVSLWDLIFEYHCFQGKWLIRWLSNNAQLPLTCCWLHYNFMNKLIIIKGFLKIHFTHSFTLVHKSWTNHRWTPTFFHDLKIILQYS